MLFSASGSSSAASTRLARTATWSPSTRGKQDGELVATKTGHDVDLPDAVDDAPANLHQHLVADAVTKRVVDLLESIEVEHHQGHRPACRLASLKLVFEAPPEERSVGQPGQGVVRCLVSQRLAEPEVHVQGEVHPTERQTDKRRHDQQQCTGHLTLLRAKRDCNEAGKCHRHDRYPEPGSGGCGADGRARLPAKAQGVEGGDTETEKADHPAVRKHRPRHAETETDLVRQLDVGDADAKDRSADEETNRPHLRPHPGHPRRDECQNDHVCHRLRETHHAHKKRMGSIDQADVPGCEADHEQPATHEQTVEKGNSHRKSRGDRAHEDERAGERQRELHRGCERRN